MKNWIVWGAMTGLVLSAIGCGSDDNGGGANTSRGGSCLTSDQCFQVSSPSDWDVKSECGFTKGTWSQNLCNPAGYTRKCTQDTQVSINDGPEQTVVYVYYFSATSMTGCLGTEENL